MTSELVRDPFADHPLTPQNCALIIIDSSPSRSARSCPWIRKGLLAACQSSDIALEAYSPLGTGRHLSDPAVAAIAADAGRTPAQVLLGWAVQRGIPVITKSTHRDRIEENLRIFDFESPDEAMPHLDALDRTGGTSNAIETRIKWR